MGKRLGVTFLVVFALATPKTGLGQTLRYNVGDPLRFGIGYNTLTGQYAGNCTANPQTADIKPAGDADAPTTGQLTRWELSSEQDLSTLTEKLDFSASASASFVAGSASMSVDYMKSRTFNKYHEFLYVSASVANGTQVWTKPALTQASLNLRKQPLDFLTKCGDTFVQTITTGGELTAILDVTTSAQEDTSSLTVSVSGDYAGVAGRAKLAQQIQQRLANHQTQVKVFRAGSTGALPTYTADQLITASLDFPTQVAVHPVPLQAQLASYDTISPPTPLTASQQAFIKPLFRAYKKTMQNLGNLTYIQSHTSEFRRIVPQAAAGMNAASAANALAEFLSSSQSTLSTNFDFADLNIQEIADSQTRQEDYSNRLEALATGCLQEPKTKCSGLLPEAPAPIVNVVRVFGVDSAWNTNAGPVDITLDQAYVCKVENIAGDWKPGDGRTLACNDSLPHGVIQGHVVVGGFDNPAQYGDNVGVCTYHFLCTRR
jgi:hypothetical protein